MNTLLKYIILFMRIIIASIFLYAGIIKFINPTSFYFDILNYQILSNTLAYIGSYFIPSLEIILGFLLLTNIKIKASTILTFSMLLVFVIAIISAWIRNIDINCGCFGKNSSNLTITFIKDIFIMCFLVIIYLYNPKNKLNYKK